MIYLGIDPGFTGAIGMVDEAGAVCATDTPVVLVNRNGKMRSEYDAAGMARLVKAEKDRGYPIKAIVERVHAMPKAGAVGMFSFGTGYGLWLGILAAFEIPYDLVEPARWKKVMLDGMGKEKDAARFRAQQLFPSLSNGLKLKKHHGRAEALLLAEYRRRIG